MKLLVAVTGASLLPVAVRVLQLCPTLGIERHLILSEHACDVAEYEGRHIDWQALCERRYPVDDIGASVSSGSYPLDGMMVVPCSMNTLAHIAHGLEHNLVTRAVAVNLKQERKVVLVPRESPLSLLQLENMHRAKLAGCSILPPNMSFYTNPRTIDDLIEQLVGKIFELFEIRHHLYPAWDP